MRKVILSVIAVLATSTSAMAANWGMAGCGVGALVFKDQPGKIQIVSATVNHLISPQTSAITSGTSNCYEGSAREEAQLFITVNQDALAKDISRGNGETLMSLSQILGCDSADQLGETLHQNYGMIFPTAATPAQDAIQAIDASIQSQPQLMKSCKIYG